MQNYLGSWRANIIYLTNTLYLLLLMLSLSLLHALCIIRKIIISLPINEVKEFTIFFSKLYTKISYIVGIKAHNTVFHQNTNSKTKY